MTINISNEEMPQIKQQLSEANRQSHFVIVELTSRETHETIHVVSDYHNYRRMREQNVDVFDFKIVRDILPITDNLAYWAKASDLIASLPDDQKVNALDDLDLYSSAVMAENYVDTTGEEPER